MDIRKLQRAIVDGLEDVKAHDIAVFNTEHLSPLFERVIVASGTSNRQTKALAASVRDAVKTSGFPVMRTEGEDNGEWIIVDCGAAVAHIMQPAIREYYHLEEIWGDKPVKMKLASQARGLPKASHANGGDDGAATRKASASRGATAPAKKTAAKKAAAKKPAAKPATGRTAAGKAATGKKASATGKSSSGARARKPAAKVAKTIVVKSGRPGTAARPAAKATAAKKKAPARKPVR
ncbi:MAG TPA: ribosome silencing factor [Methylibium sp.]